MDQYVFTLILLLLAGKDITANVLTYDPKPAGARRKRQAEPEPAEDNEAYVDVDPASVPVNFFPPLVSYITCD